MVDFRNFFWWVGMDGLSSMFADLSRVAVLVIDVLYVFSLF